MFELPEITGPVDPYADYEPLNFCADVEQPGTRAFRAWILGDVEGFAPNSADWRAGDWGILRKCEPNRQKSKHDEGRAWDWHPSSPAKAETLIAALLASGVDGEPHAMARRAGIRTLIWNKRIWHSGKRGWRDYRGTNPHDDHVHFGLSWAGAKGETSLYQHFATKEPDSPLVVGRSGGDNDGRSGPKPEGKPVNPCTSASHKLDAEPTPLSEMEVARELARAYLALYGQAPSVNLLGVAWAQVQLETGRGTKLYNFNFGNITCGSSWRGAYQELKDGTNEPHYYRAYVSAAAGAKDYWELLHGRYKPALAYFERGDAPGAAFELSALGYFTAPPEPIARSFGKLFASYEKRSAGPTWAAAIVPLAAFALAAQAASK